MNIELHIGQLVLDGIVLTPAQAQRVRLALQRELTQQLAAGGLSVELARGIAIPAINGGSIGPMRDSAPVAIGQRIAQAVYQSIGGTDRSAVSPQGRQGLERGSSGGAHE